MKASARHQKNRTLDSAMVLRYHPKPASRSTVRRHYAAWREAQAIQPRCDIEECIYFSSPLLWCGKKLPLILDHINGNNRDNSPNNLRYICPNCDSQLSTRGGANRGRVLEAGEGQYVLLSRNGSRHFHLICETGHYQLKGHAPTVSISHSLLSDDTQPGVQEGRRQKRDAP
jgi:hypothetical protein